jgi:hypothetical protein
LGEAAVTEEEAKTKWCPHVRAYGLPEFPAFNRHSDGSVDRATGCIGSACMMWRWGILPMQLHSFAATDGWDHVSAEDSEDGRELWLEPEAQQMARRRGFCGLAGKP